MVYHVILPPPTLPLVFFFSLLEKQVSAILKKNNNTQFGQIEEREKYVRFSLDPGSMHGEAERTTDWISEDTNSSRFESSFTL